MDDPTRYLPAEESPAALAILFAASLVEYVFPPFPGDTVTLFGAFLVGARGWSLAPVFLAATTGSVVGAALDWYVGGALQRWRRKRPGVDSKRRRAVDRLVVGFQRHGPAYVVLNRFVPVMRALFLVAAGMADMPARPVLFYAAVSAVLWNAALMAAGMTVGVSWETLLVWYGAYTRVVWALIGGAILVAGAVWLLRRRASR